MASFLTTLNTCCGAYTGFTYNGGSINLPYCWGAKNTPDQIRAAITKGVGASTTTAAAQEYATKHPDETGVDCSGLVYYALNKASSGAVRTFFEQQLNCSGLLTYAYGIGASNLTNTAYGTQITAAKDIKPGCVLRTQNGGHIIVIHSVNKNSSGIVTSIVYAHSNGSKGPHHGYITIGDQAKDLNHSSQTWSDIAYTDAQAKSLYNYTLLLTPIAGLV